MGAIANNKRNQCMNQKNSEYEKESLKSPCESKRYKPEDREARHLKTSPNFKMEHSSELPSSNLISWFQIY